MILNIDNIPKLDKKRGEEITYTEINELAISVYNKFNFLHCDNVVAVDTSKWLDFESGALLEQGDTYQWYPNYCGMLYHTDATPTIGTQKRSVYTTPTIDVQLSSLNDDLDDLINKHNGV